MKIQSVIYCVMRPLITIAFVLFLSFSVSALEIPPEQYPFPTKDPAIATLLASFSPSTAKYKYWPMAYRPERLKKKYPLHPPTLNLETFQQSKEAPLALIIGGLGSNSPATNSSALGDIYIKAGYHVISLPNNLSFTYTTAISESALPGYMSRDSVEYYQFVQWLLNYAKTKKKMKISSIVVIGYSNGGLLASFLATLDRQQPIPLFKKILMINPAVDVMYGVQQLDYLNDVVGSKISLKMKNFIMGCIYSEAINLLTAKDPVAALFKLLKEKNFQTHHIQWLIGSQYRDSLRWILVYSHFTQNRGFLKSPYSKYNLNDLEDEALTINFTKYMYDIVVPSLPETKTVRDFAYESSMYSQMESLRTDPRVFLFTNVDDFVLRPSDIQLLRDNFGPRLFLFPYGGHMGNIMVPFNVQMYLKVSQ